MLLSPAEKMVIARTAHAINRAYCQALGDQTQPVWDEAPQWQKDSARLQVDFHLDNPEAGPDASHIAWMEEKEREGWQYGPVKDPEEKEHPCLVPFAELPLEQQAKDHLFRAVVHAMAEAASDLRGEPAADVDPIDRRTHIERING